MLADAVLAHAQGRVVAALPSDHETKRVILDANDNLVDQRADNPLADRGCLTRAVPGSLDIGAECEQTLPFRDGERRLRTRCERVAFVFKGTHRKQTLIPSMLKFSCDKAVVGIDSIVLTPRKGGLIAGLLKGKIDLAPLLGILDLPCLHSTDRCFDTERLEALDHLGANGAIDPHAAERYAWIAAMVEMASATMVAPRTPVLAAVGNVELAAAMTAAKKAGKQGLSTSHSAAAHETLTVGVVADQALIPLKLGPCNVSIMMVEDQNLPDA